MRTTLISIAVLLLAACGAQSAGTVTPSTGTVTGHVRAYPCAPVQRVGSPCAGRPAAHVEIDFRLGSHAPIRGITDSDGAYAVQLAPGIYQVSIGLVHLLSGAKTVTVTGGHTVTDDFVFDSGIR